MSAMTDADVAENRERLLWCSLKDFDALLRNLDTKGLIGVVHTLQESMAVEQQTFDSLRQRIITQDTQDLKQEQRLQAALLTSQSRLSKLCERSERCFHQSRVVGGGIIKKEIPPSLTLQEEEEEERGKKMEKQHSSCQSKAESGVCVTADSSHNINSGLKEEADVPSPVPFRRPHFRSLEHLLDDVTKDEDNINRVGHIDSNNLARAPSIEEILASVKALRRSGARSAGHGLSHSSSTNDLTNVSVVKSTSKATMNSLLGVRFNASDPLPPIPKNFSVNVKTEEESCYENVDELCLYENVSVGGKKNSGGHVSFVDRGTADGAEEPHYENVRFESAQLVKNLRLSCTGVYSKLEHNHYENVEGLKTDDDYVDDGIYENVTIDQDPPKQQTYDVPRSATHIYDVPKTNANKVPSSLLPQAAKLLLQVGMMNNAKKKIRECDMDSLEDDDVAIISGTSSSVCSSPEDHRGIEPEIPSPDYGSDDEELASGSGGDFSDEGLGESDARSYYNEEQGLEVILEEPEEEERERNDVIYGTANLIKSSPLCQKVSTALPSAHNSLIGNGKIISPENSEGIGSGEEEDEDGSRSSSDIPNLPLAEEDIDQQEDRSLDVYQETLRQRNTKNVKAAIPRSLDPAKCKDGKLSSHGDQEQVLPSVRALLSQFEGRNMTDQNKPTKSNQRVPTSPRKIPSSSSPMSYTNQNGNGIVEAVVPPIHLPPVEDELLRPKPTIKFWDPSHLLQTLYHIPQPSVAPSSSCPTVTYVNIEGYLDKLPSGKRKNTYWNAWKRRYFKAKDGYLYYYQNEECQKASLCMQLMGGKIETMEATTLAGSDAQQRHPLISTIVGIDDGKGHYVVVRCTSKVESERWRRALLTHTAENFSAAYVKPWPFPIDSQMHRNTLVVDLGSCSVRAGLLCSYPTLPQVFFPSVMAVDKESGRKVFGAAALRPSVRGTSNLTYPIRPSQKITKYSVDLPAVVGLINEAFKLSGVKPSETNLVLSVPRRFNATTQAELARLLFSLLHINSLALANQSVLALYAYGAKSGVVVDVGERMDVIPIVDGYIVEGGVSRVPYGGPEMIDHLRRFLLQQGFSAVTEVESYLVRLILERMCYIATDYMSELQQYARDSTHSFQKISVAEFFDETHRPWEAITLDTGRFQATEGLFNPEVWGLDHVGLHKLVYKAIQASGMDARKEMTSSIYLAGGVTQLPGLSERLRLEIDKLTPPSLTPRVHSSTYAYHASYLGACVLANSPTFVEEFVISQQEWIDNGHSVVKKWKL